MLTVLSEILHRNEAGCFVPKRGRFNGNIAAGIFIWPRIFCEITSHILFSLCVSRAFKTQRNTSLRTNKDVSFPLLLEFTVHENTIAS